MEAARISGRFFYNVGTLEELRGQYRKQVMKYHPDHGGRTEDMQELNAEYDRFYSSFEAVARRNGNKRRGNDRPRKKKSVRKRRRKRAAKPRKQKLRGK